MRPAVLTAPVWLAALVAVAGCGDDGKRTTTAAAPQSVVATLPDRFFAADSPWNSRVDGLPVDPESGALLRRAARRVGVVERDGDPRPRLVQRVVRDGVYVNTRAWTTPIVTGGEETRLLCRQASCGTGDDIRSLRVPANVDPDPRFDGWFTIVSPDGRTAYDLWRARREHDGSISYDYLREWNLGGSGAGEPSEVAARGSGLPLFAGVIGARELADGEINHALAISVPGPAQRRYVRPASVTNGNGSLDSLPEGARVRLKADVRMGSVPLTRRQQRARDAVVVALRRYGAIVVDRAAVPTLYAQRGIAADSLTGDELAGLHLSDFEVIRRGQTLEDPPAEAKVG
jgi:hypothetical protein